MKSAKPATPTAPMRARHPVSACARAARRRAGVPAGRARNRGNAAVADRPRDRGHHHPAVLRGAGLGLVGHDRHRCVGDRKNRAERSHQGHPAVRDRGGALHSGAGRAGGQGRRRADRARSDRKRGGTRSPAQRPPRRAAQHRAAARGARRRRRSCGRLHAARRCRPGTDQRPASALAQPGDRASRQDRRARPSAGAEGSRASHDRGHHPQARDDDSGHPAARRHPQDAHGQGAGLEAHLFRDPPAAGRATRGTQRSEEPSARGGGGRGRDSRDARPGGGRISRIRSPTNSPRPSRRRAGSPRT